MSQEHYFSPDPSAPAKITELDIEVGGQELRLSASTGTFSSERLDPGTRVLLGLWERFPREGLVLDIGCGWGPIGISIAKLSPAAEVIGVDVNQRSVELANSNAKRNGIFNFKAVLDSELDVSIKVDHIWSNPPIRIGKSNLHKLLKTYLGMLKPTGEAYLVVQKQLGAESLQRWIAEHWPDREVSKVENSKGYRVIRVR